MKSDRLRIGVAGLGRAFSLMLPTFVSDPRVHLVAACDPREQARHQFESDFETRTYTDIDGLCSDPNVEIIYIASPHQFHARHVEIAAKHGKHVMVEKPMALSMDECDRMIAACQSAGVYLIVGHCHSFDTPYLRARELIQSGQFGAVKMVHAVNFTDYLYRPRRPEELLTSEGGGAVFSQAAHQVDIVRLLVSSDAVRIQATVGNWDPSRPTEGAYSALVWFENGANANLFYSGYGHFNTDEWTGWIGEMGDRTDPATYGNARQRLAGLASPTEEARLKAAGTYGGTAYKPPLKTEVPARFHQHFGSILILCEKADIRPLPDSVVVYGDQRREVHPLDLPAVPRAEVIDELYGAVRLGQAPIHDGLWAKKTLQICVAILASSKSNS